MLFLYCVVENDCCYEVTFLWEMADAGYFGGSVFIYNPFITNLKNDLICYLYRTSMIRSRQTFQAIDDLQHS